MKHLYLAAALLACSSITARAQVGVGTTTPDAKSALEIKATDKGLLIPRLTAAQRTAITSPPQGLMVSQTDGSASGGPQTGFWYYAGAPAQWVFLNPTAGADNLGNHTATQPLNLQGNALTGAGASIGTTVGVGVRADGGLNLGENTSGNNVALGYQAEQAITSGASNLFVGYQSGGANQVGSGNTFLGHQSGYSNKTDYNVFIGYQSGYDTTNGYQNVFSGYKSGYTNLTGNFNIFSGGNSGYSNTTGSRNLFSGFQSGYSNEGGDDNIFLGFNSGFTNKEGNSNIFIGSESGRTTYFGSRNVFIGERSGYYNDFGGNNVAIGYNSGPNTNASNLTNATALGANAVLTNSNTVVLGNNANVGIGTSNPGQKLDVVGAVRTGTPTTPATLYGTPTGTNNMLAVAYGQLGGFPISTYSTSGNYTFTRNAAGTYTLTFSSSSGLNTLNLDNAAVVATLYGSTPGFINWTGGTGSITFRTFDLNGTASDRLFTFSMFTP